MCVGVPAECVCVLVCKHARVSVPVFPFDRRVEATQGNEKKLKNTYKPLTSERDTVLVELVL